MIARGEVKSAEALGRMLQQGRLVKGLTQREIADRLDTDQKYIWALESGKNKIVLDRIFEIMRETGLRMYMELDFPPEPTGVKASWNAPREQLSVVDFVSMARHS
ncbi:MAG: helix-turn-helix transcriptional regulator [Actinomycetales bacterium]|nr:helix-turn-helix transcriptional regulator [Actinomycetales bacterium]